VAKEIGSLCQSTSGLGIGFCNPFPPTFLSRVTYPINRPAIPLQSGGNSCALPARIGKKRRLPEKRRVGGGAARREQKKSGKSKRGQSLKGESRQRAPSMESSISRTELNCISLADPDIQKSVALLKQVRGSFLIIAILVNRCTNSRKLETFFLETYDHTAKSFTFLTLCPYTKAISNFYHGMLVGFCFF
jgi:hypothetical protein